MKTSIIAAICLLFACNLQAQNTIDIRATGTVQLPADVVVFDIQINAEADNPQQTFDLHKQREQRLVSLLKKHDIEENQVQYQPVAIYRNSVEQPDGTVKATSRTIQDVTLRLQDFDIFEAMQLALIEADFDSFKANFDATGKEEAKNEALQNALSTAREKAEIIAAETGAKLGPAQKISYQEGFRTFGGLDELVVTGLREYNQSVRISTNVTVTYSIEYSD